MWTVPTEANDVKCEWVVDSFKIRSDYAMRSDKLKGLLFVPFICSFYITIRAC